MTKCFEESTIKTRLRCLCQGAQRAALVRQKMRWIMKDYLLKRRAELKKRGNKGFTLMEMLIVVAIIAVLIAIAIPIFTSQLENSREATDAANLRSAYAEVAADYLTSGGTPSRQVAATQAQDGWQNTTLSNGSIGDVSMPPAKINNASWTITAGSDGKISIS